MIPDDPSMAGHSSMQWVMTWDCFSKNTWAGQPRIIIPPDSTEEIATYCLCGNENGLSWKAYDNLNIVLQGSMDDIFEIYIDPNVPSEKKLRVRSEYDGSVNRYHYISLDDTGKIQADYLNATSPQQVMIWEQSTQCHALLQNPSSVTGKTYFLSGDSSTGLSWDEGSRPFSLMGSMDNIFELTVDPNDPDEDVLRVRSEYNGSINKFHFLNLDDTGKISAVS